LAEAYAALAQVYLQTGRPLRATESAEAALRQNSKEPTALQVQKTLADDPKLLTVRTTVQEQVKRDPNNAEAHAVLSALLLHAEEWEDARTEATTALKLKPDESHALAVLAQLAMHEEKWDEARHILEQALDHDEKNEHLWGTLAEVAIGQKDAEMAVRAARYAVSLAPEHKKWHDLLIAAYELAGNKAAAEQERQKNTHP
jgi:tetratricopeptide (TPR) repeat protein